MMFLQYFTEIFKVENVRCDGYILQLGSKKQNMCVVKIKIIIRKVIN